MEKDSKKEGKIERLDTRTCWGENRRRKSGEGKGEENGKTREKLK